MKKIALVSSIAVIIFCVTVVLTSCEKEKEPVAPEVTTNTITAITITTATTGGNVTSDGGATVTARGVCWSSTSQTPAISDSKTEDGTGTGSFTSELTGLDPGTTYNIRAYATNSAGTAYGDAVSFTTLAAGQVKDADGNIYNSVTIGNQVWMAENLRTTKYNDGTDIPNNTGGWSNMTTPAYCWYDNDSSSYADPYGALYNYHTVEAGKLCPEGWHVPTVQEWVELITYLGGNFVAGGKLKEEGTTHWQSPNTGATDDYSFKAVPGGNKYPGFRDIGLNAGFWSFCDDNSYHVHYTTLSYNSEYVGTSSYCVKYYGRSVRCLKD